MDLILAELKELKSEFDALPDGFTRYSYLVELSALLPEAEGLRRAEHRYRGCQSEVWLRVGVENGLCRLDAYSDTLLIRGVLALFRELLDARPAQAVLAARFDLLDELGIGEHFTSRRTSGVAGLLPEIQRRLTNEL